MNIELRHLRYFIAVAEELHFGRAAQRLSISQPPLSQQIRQLEDSMEAQLLLRTRRRVQLTQAGEQFLQDARQIVALTAQAVERAARRQRGEEGTLRIGFTSSAPFVPQISQALFRYRHRYPEVQIQMQEINTRQQLAPLQEGRLDLSIMRNTALPDDLRYQLLLREPLFAVLHREHPLAKAEKLGVQQLAQQPFVFFDPQVGTALYSEILALLHSYNIHPAVTQEVGEAMTIIGLVSSGLGVSILPASFRRARLDEVVWVPLAESDARSEIWLVWSGERPVTASMMHMMQFLLPSA